MAATEGPVVAVEREPACSAAGSAAGCGAAVEPGAGVELRVEVRPCGPFRLPLRGGMDGVLRRRGRVLERLLHHHDEPVVARVAQTGPGCVLFGARARTRVAAEYGIARMRFSLGVDDDLDGFRRRFRDDPLIGASLRRRPWLRVMRRPEPFEALAWAICEQLIEYERAAAIQRRLVARFGRRLGEGEDLGDGGDGGLGGWGAGLRDAPTAAALAGAAPAQLQSFDLSGGRARVLVRAAREVARGRIDLHGAEHERAWLGLRAIPGIGAWTVEVLALLGQGRYDQVPAGDLGLIKLVGRLRSGGDPRARATEEDVRAFFAPYGEWRGLAAAHLMGLVG